MVTRGVWLTGLSGAGKTTIAKSLQEKLYLSGIAACVIDGDDLRSGLSKDLGFSESDRDENVRRAAELARVVSQSGIFPIVSLISPLEKHREIARKIADVAIVHVSTPLETCISRDPKGLYKKAHQGLVPLMTGTHQAYETPRNPDISIDASVLSVADCVDSILRGVGTWKKSKSTTKTQDK